MRVLIDTNVVVYILGKREPFFEHSYRAVRDLIKNEDKCMVAASVVTDIYYILNNLIKDKDETKNRIATLLEFLYIVDVVAMDIEKALSGHIKDFEDGVLIEIADRIDAQYILTRNTKDFKESSVKAITPTEYLQMNH